jgi:hypothetical protein
LRSYWIYNDVYQLWRPSGVLTISLQQATVEEAKQFLAKSFLLTYFFNQNVFTEFFFVCTSFLENRLSFRKMLCHVHFMLLRKSYNAIFLIFLNISLYHEQNKLFCIWFYRQEVMLWLYLESYPKLQHVWLFINTSSVWMWLFVNTAS